MNMDMRRLVSWLWHLSWKVSLLGVLLSSAFCHATVLTPVSDNAGVSSIVGQVISPTVQAAPTPQQRGRARERAQRGRVLFLTSLLYQGALLGAFFLLGGSRWLMRLVTRFGGQWLLALLAVVGLCSLAEALLLLPFDYYRGFIFEHQYGLSNQTSWQWLRDYLLESGVSVVTGLPVLLLAYLLLRKAPRYWWLWLTAASIPLSIFFMLITPVFISPLFNHFTPLHEESLRQELLTLAKQHGIHAKDVYQVDASEQSNAVNAYVIGFGPTQRIVLYDTLLRQFSHEEITFIMSHEMGHYVLGHIWKGIAFTVMLIFLSLYVLYRVSRVLLTRFGGWLGYTTLGDPTSYPLLLALLFVTSLLVLPVANSYSRRIEWEADRYAVRIDPHPEAGIAAFQKLALVNVAEEDPPYWYEVLFSSHPSLAERINALRRYQAGDRNPWPIPVAK